jgi:hypothetical protein
MALVLIIWFLFVAPMEKQMHRRKIELMKRKIERNEERIRQEKGTCRGDDRGDDFPG